MKFFIRQTARNIARHKYKSLFYLLIGVLTVFLLAVYAGNLDSTKRQLERLPEVMKITARISNLNGSMTDGVKIREDRVDGILTSEYVQDPVFSVRLKWGFGEFSREEYQKKLNHYGVGMNAVGGVPGLKAEEITCLEGVDISILETAEKVCIMDADLMTQEGFSLGDDVMLTSYYYHLKKDGSDDVLIDPLVTETYRIVGSVQIGEYLGDWMPAELILPLNCVREAYQRQDIEFEADSCSFVVKDPFLLNECKEKMHNMGFFSVITQADFHYKGIALTIMDQDFIRSVRTLNENLALLKGMLPFITVIIFFIGYICSYLSIQGRREEYALMRSLGTGRGRSFGLFLGETMLLQAMACFFGSLAAGQLFSTPPVVLALSGTLFFAAFLSGTVVALFALYSLSVIELLTTNN
ncbi:MAG: hypothetical protein K2M22_02490 [Lachnospiraceae bacterium]|nr:hypothetical protein [Lachnospiraceae bacterium]MDE7176922.1 hypothetical protein [Lachnospiraceae bacterium]